MGKHTQKDVFSEYTLMSIATIGAFFIGEYPEGVAVMLFYAVGELFQSSAINRAKRNISALLDVRPETATVIKNDTTETMPPEKVEVGQTVEVKVGERVPLPRRQIAKRLCGIQYLCPDRRKYTTHDTKR